MAEVATTGVELAGIRAGGAGAPAIGSTVPPTPHSESQRLKLEHDNAQLRAELAALDRPWWRAATALLESRLHLRSLTVPILLALVLASCRRCDDGPEPGEATSSAAGLREVSAAIYDAAESDGDVASYIEGVFLAFGVEVFGEPSPALDERVARGQPFLFAPQMHELADAFADGGYVSVDSLIVAAAERGVTTPKGARLDRAYLDARLRELASKQVYTPDETLPAFVLALAAERAARHGGADPLWGDGQLDPLQTTLLMYAFSYGRSASRRAAPPRPRPYRGSKKILEFVGDRLQGQVEGIVVSWIELPTDADDDAARAVVCASLQLYGHKMTVTAMPDLVYHQQADVAAPPPHSTTVTAVLTFQDDYWDNRVSIDQWILNTLLDCKLQRRGPVPDKPLAWDVSAALREHGGFNIASSITNDDGAGVSHWSTVVETTPARKRTFANQRDAVGSVIVRAGDLVPGWSTVERAVGILKDTGNTGDTPLSVIYYVDPCTMPGVRAFADDPMACVDTWSGTVETTYTPPVSKGTWGWHMTAAVTWHPTFNIAGVQFYSPTGTVTFEMNLPGCMTTVVPDTMTLVPNDAPALEVDYTRTPPTYAMSGRTFWDASVTLVCPDMDPGTVVLHVGGDWLFAEWTPLTSSGQMTGSLSANDHESTWSFSREP